MVLMVGRDGYAWAGHGHVRNRDGMGDASSPTHGELERGRSHAHGPRQIAVCAFLPF
ncbi:hypothetical protein BD414DRAFT_475100 [Trametes punicea]|nr:hypothetical protein BD414DRAFT_475100 [Trametes punicea]